MRIKKRILSLSLISALAFTIVPKDVQASDIRNGAKYSITYEKTDISNIMPLTLKQSELNEEVIESRIANANIRKLVPMTNYDYEVALAYEDGSYSFIKGYNNLDSAKVKCNELEQVLTEEENIIPVVIDGSGQVTYGTKLVGRVRKYENGKIVSGTSDVHSTSALNSAHTYVNHDYLSEVPLIGTSGQSASVLIGGYNGWMKYTNQGDYNNKTVDVVLWPLNQVTTPSYYIVENGILKHWASTSLDGGSGSLLFVGTAPSYLEEGVKYSSYDGNYFYKGATLQDSIWDLTLDLKEGRKNRAVNPNNPYYGYFNNLPIRSKSNYTAAEIDKFIDERIKDKPTSKLKGLGTALKEAEEKYGVNALIILGVAINESAWGTSKISQEKNNLFGIKAFDSSPGESASTYATPGDSVLDFSQNYMSNGYANPRDWRYWGAYLGNKKLGANVKYASDPFWGEKAASFAMQADIFLGGKDENYYQLIQYTGTNTVVGSDGTLFYNISTTNVSGTSGGSIVGTNTVQASGKKVTINGKTYLEINADRNFPQSSSDFDGNYNWNTKGYILESNIQFLNNGKTGFKECDFNFDDVVDLLDLSEVSNRFNLKTEDTNFKSTYDLNNDGIIDIFDIVRVASKIN